jgi:cbb3-type cytochrome oxidase subunit 3
MTSINISYGEVPAGYEYRRVQSAWLSLLFADARHPWDARRLQIKLDSPAMIAWYCFLAVVILPVLLCGIFYLFKNHSSHEREQAAVEDEQRIESIEANVQAWSAAEQSRHDRIIKSAVRNNMKVRPGQQFDVHIFSHQKK